MVCCVQLKPAFLVSSLWHIGHALWHVYEISIGRLPATHWFLDIPVFATGLAYAALYYKLTRSAGVEYTAVNDSGGSEMDFELASNTANAAAANARRDRRMS